MFTKTQLQFFFGNRIKLIPITKNLIDKLKKIKIKDNHPYYSLPSVVAGKTHKEKISLVANILKKNKSDYLFISASENVSPPILVDDA